MKNKFPLLITLMTVLFILGTNTISHSNTSSVKARGNEMTDQTILEDISSFLSTDYIQMHDRNKKFNSLAQIEKLNKLAKKLEKSKDNLPVDLTLAAQTMITQLKMAIYNDKLHEADFYVDQYLGLLYAVPLISSHYDALHLYSISSEDGPVHTSNDWNQLSKNKKISIILAMKATVLSQEAVQYAPSTLYLYEQLEQQQIKGNITNKIVQLLFN